VTELRGNAPVIDVGSQFGAYTILGKLGEGGMGVVYGAVDSHLQRQVAIKTLIGSPETDASARFLREAKAASRLQHPAVVTIYHIGVEAGLPYIVMELVEGSTLKKMIAGRPMNLRHACDVAIQVCEGLVAAHEMGVIHRDIKAENVIITPRGAVKILDFGLAKLAESQTADAMTMVQTQAGVVMGTVSHMSPEQALGRDVDARTDIFSFGHPRQGPQLRPRAGVGGQPRGSSRTRPGGRRLPAEGP
jgi:serine/threonine protein kinase